MYFSKVKNKMTNYERSINYLESLLKFGIKPGLDRIKYLLRLIDQPQEKFKIIHVTGTNGKGSVCATLAEILKTAKFKVGLFTSPHLISYRERFKINGVEISENDFTNLVDDMKILVDQMIADGYESPTEFEVLTAMAFKYFADQKVDYAVIEVGLGGLLDSTNVVKPKISVITNVANDHAEKCGGDLYGIARHKAGIIKEKIPIVTGASDEPLKIISEVAKQKNSKIFVLNKDFFVDDSLKISLQGEYQKLNAAIAVETAKLLNEDQITDEVIKTAIQNVKWQGRFEIFHYGDKTLIIDGAHNGAGAKALRKSLDKKFSTDRRIFLFGVLADKDIDEMIKILFREDDFVIVTKPNSLRAADPKKICELLQERSIESIAIEDNEKAFEKFINSDEKILIAAGSLYMIGKIREKIISI
ncbi:MAG: bifunctional folylpolyglutamate synthase/dihydrofolate synthase [Selenomonadaceae bacterium]|nr:bifunctional folylpolyglutamate synthase/dihydrofolate synthase [Selenomonadaceae bacterium]